MITQGPEYDVLIGIFTLILTDTHQYSHMVLKCNACERTSNQHQVADLFVYWHTGVIHLHLKFSLHDRHVTQIYEENQNAIDYKGKSNFSPVRERPASLLRQFDGLMTKYSRYF